MIHKYTTVILCNMYTTVMKEEPRPAWPGRRWLSNQETAGGNISFAGGNIGAVDGVAQLFHLLFAALIIAGAALTENEAVGFGRVQLFQDGGQVPVFGVHKAVPAERIGNVLLEDDVGGVVTDIDPAPAGVNGDHFAAIVVTDRPAVQIGASVSLGGVDGGQDGGHFVTVAGKSTDSIKIQHKEDPL